MVFLLGIVVGGLFEKLIQAYFGTTSSKYEPCRLLDKGCPNPTCKGESCFGLPSCYRERQQKESVKQ